MYAVVLAAVFVAGGAIDRFQRRGVDVVAFDSRAHGESDGEMCTYGYWEKRDLARGRCRAAARG